LSLEQWIWCLAFGFGTLLWFQVVTLYPTSWCPDIMSWKLNCCKKKEPEVFDPTVDGSDVEAPADKKKKKDEESAPEGEAKGRKSQQNITAPVEGDPKSQTSVDGGKQGKKSLVAGSTE